MVAAGATPGGTPLALRSICLRYHRLRPKPALCIALRVTASKRNIENQEVIHWEVLMLNQNDPETKAQIVYFSHGGGPLPILGDPGHKAMVDFMLQLAISA